MSLTHQEAVDEILAMFKEAWDSASGGPYPVQWANVGQVQAPPTTTSPWARVTFTHVTGRQATLSWETGNRRFARTGLLAVEVFVPIGEGSQKGYTLGKLVLDAFEGEASPGGVWFRNVKMRESGVEKGWFQVNVTAEATYDEVK
jgi:hypothetical protein